MTGIKLMANNSCDSKLYAKACAYTCHQCSMMTAMTSLNSVNKVDYTANTECREREREREKGMLDLQSVRNVGY